METRIRRRLQTINKASVLLRVVCKVLLALIALAGLGSVTCVVIGIGGIDVDQSIFRTSGLSLGVRVALGAVTVLVFGALLKCVYHLNRLFANYAVGEIFARDSVKQLRQFGMGCALWSVMSFFWLSALALCQPTPRTFHGHVDSIVVGAVIVVIAWFMDMAVDLREESDLTI